MNEWLLPMAVAIPAATALRIALAPQREARSIALWGSLLSILPVVLALGSFDIGRRDVMYQLNGTLEAIPALGLSLSWGVDGVALLLILLSAFLVPVCVLASWSSVTNDEAHRPRLFYGWLMALAAAMVTVFAARDLLLFYIGFEFTLLPMFILIRVFGSTERQKASTRFFLYTFTGSLLTLAGLLYVAYRYAESAAGVEAGWTLDIETLGAFARRALTPEEQGWVLAAMLAGFAVKIPLFPVHTWLPLAHTEAPTAGSVILAGVLLKLGTYGLFRFVLGYTPDAVIEHAATIAVLSIIGVIYAGLVCWVQRDVKKLVAYSSVSHLGFCVLGLFALNPVGLNGSVLYMINHGLSTGALFCCVGFMYERYHTRDMRQLGGLASKMPVWATFMVFFTMASVGLPGLNGFVSELMCLLGAFQSGFDRSSWSSYPLTGDAAQSNPGATPGPLGPWFALAAGLGMIIAAIYLLYMVGKVVFGPLVEPEGHADPSEDDVHNGRALPRDLNTREILTLSALAIPCIAFGLYPKPLLNAIDVPIERTLMEMSPDRSEIPEAVRTRPAPVGGRAGGQAGVATADRGNDHGETGR